jgi:hypothetical protein
MAGIKISALPAGTTLTGTELVPIVQSSATVSTTPAAIKTYTNTAIPNSALAQISTSTTDTTNANLVRNGDWGFGSGAVDIPSFEAVNANYARFGRALPGAVGGSGAAMSVIAAPYDGTPTTNYLGMSSSTTGNARLWVGTKAGSSPGTIGWTEFAKLDSPVFSTRVSIGGSDTASLFGITNAGQLTSSVVYGSYIRPIVQSTLTTNAYGSVVTGQTAAESFTLGSWRGYSSLMAGTIGAGSAITAVYGFIADSSLGNDAAIVNAYGYYSTIVAGTNRWQIYMQGSANSYFGGPIGLGTTSIGGTTGFTGLRVDRNITGASGGNITHVRSAGTIQSDVTGTATMIDTSAATQATTFTLTQLNHFRALQGTIGAGSTVSNQVGYLVDSSLIGATNNYGFRGQIAAATGRWNLYLDGTAQNYIAGNIGIGSNSFSGYTLRVNKALDNNSHKGVASEGQVTNGGSNVDYFYTNSSQATAISTTLLSHYRATQGTYTSAPSAQAGFNADSTLTGATNNYGFRGQIAAATGRWNLYMDGAAQNFIQGNVGIGTGKTVPTCALDVNGLVAESAANTLTAAGTNLATALALTAAYNVVTSAAASTGVALPNVVGAQVWVFNNQGTNAINVYPPTGTLNGAASVSLAANAKMMYVQIAAGVWYTMS